MKTLSLVVLAASLTGVAGAAEPSLEAAKADSGLKFAELGAHGSARTRSAVYAAKGSAAGEARLQRAAFEGYPGGIKKEPTKPPKSEPGFWSRVHGEARSSIRDQRSIVDFTTTVGIVLGGIVGGAAGGVAGAGWLSVPLAAAGFVGGMAAGAAVGWGVGVAGVYIYETAAELKNTAFGSKKSHWER
jgi:hypothetical protein